MNRKIKSKDIRTYKISDSCIFKRNKDAFGSLSNMASYPLEVNNIKIRTSEALYQLCRFPHLPEVQKKIIEQKSPMTAKMVSRGNIKKSRKDWEKIKIKVMRWCLKVKLAQHFIDFGNVLESTGHKFIVENSSKDNYWGAIINSDNVYVGVNVLGRLLMELRDEYFSPKKYDLLYVAPPDIKNFLILDEQIQVIDERKSFIYSLERYWNLAHFEFRKDDIYNNLNYNEKNISKNKEIGMQLPLI